MSFTLPIAQKIMSEFNWNNILAMIAKKLPQVNANSLFEEFKKFLFIKFIDEDIDGDMYSPSYAVDEVWHIFLLFPKGRRIKFLLTKVVPFLVTIISSLKLRLLWNVHEDP